MRLWHTRYRIKLWSTGTMHKPKSPTPRLAIEFTNKCNFRCTLCPQSTYRKPSPGGNRFDRDKGYLSDEVFDAFLVNARKYAKRVTVGFFGEPMLHPKFSEYMTKLAESRSYKLTLFSNWALFADEMVPAIKGCDEVRISLDASNNELFQTLCPSSEYYTIVGNIQQWLRVRNRPHTYLVFVTSSINQHDKGTFLRAWLPKLPKRDGVITKAAISYGGVMKDDYMYANTCNILQKRRMVVAWNGDCSPCNLDVNIDMNVGNVLRGGMAEIAASEQYASQLISIRHRSGICVGCFDSNNHRETVFHSGELSYA